MSLEAALSDDAALQCPDVAARVTRDLGAAIARETARVEIAVTREAEAFVGHVMILVAGAGPVTQTLTDPSCAVLTDAIALVVAITIDPDLFRGEAPAMEAALDDERPPAPPEPVIVPAGPAIGGLVRIAAGGALGLLPDLGPMLELTLGLTLDGWVRIEASARGVFPQVVRYAPTGAPGAEVGLLWGAVGACLVPRALPELALGGCAAVEVGAALGTGRGIAEAVSAAAPLVMLEGSARLEWWLVPGFGVVVSVGVSVPVVRPVFRIDGLGRLYRPEPVDGTLRVGLEFHFS